MDKWRPLNWVNPFKEEYERLKGSGWLGETGVGFEAYEDGADAMLQALFELANQSPTKTFTIDSRQYQIFEVE